MAASSSTSHIPFHLGYSAPSGLTAEGAGARLNLPGNLYRPPVHLAGRIRDPLKFREALGALYDIVGADYRYVPKDRTAYLAYRQMRRETAGQNAWQAQQAYFDWLARNDPMAWLILDPLISVHPDCVLFEVFSKDEGVYANFAFSHTAFDLEDTPICGTTNIDFSPSFRDGVLQMRSYRQTMLTIGGQEVSLRTDGAREVIEKRINVPDSWLRGFLQVQSAATLPREIFSLAPIDLYNVFRRLRMHADQKGKRRGLRIELAPGEKPLLVLEPWESVIESHGDIYRGKRAHVVRVWGRRRLMLLQRILGWANQVEVHLLGSGLPSFWVLRCGDMTATLGLTGFTAANWSQAINFDLLLPRKTQTSQPLEAVLGHLSQVWYDKPGALAQALGTDGASLLEAVQLGCQHGRLMYDLASQVYRLRPVTETALDLSRLEYRSAQERIAYDLVHRQSAVKITSTDRILESGLEITGQASVAEDRREYRPQLTLADDGGVRGAECTCTFFRKQGLKAGPCPHLIALRLAYSLQQRELQAGRSAESTITAETRAFSRRSSAGERVYQITLDHRRVRIRWGLSGQKQRLVNLRFNTVDEARCEYFARITALQSRGYLDATTGL